MNEQRLAIIGACGLFLILYFGFDITSPAQQAEIQSRTEAGLDLNLNTVIKQAGESLGTQEKSELARLEIQLQQAGEAERLTYLKELSGFWYRQSQFYIAGSFAEQVAEEENTDNAWGIAGTTYLAGVSNTQDKEVQICQSKADESLQKAISLDPDNISHRINLCLNYVKKPPQNNPMKGIQMLLSLNERHPNSVPVLFNLAKLAVETGQYERAEERLKKAVALEPENPRVVCLLSDVLSRVQNQEAPRWKEKCDLLNEKAL